MPRFLCFFFSLIWKRLEMWHLECHWHLKLSSTTCATSSTALKIVADMRLSKVNVSKIIIVTVINHQKKKEWKASHKKTWSLFCLQSFFNILFCGGRYQWWLRTIWSAIWNTSLPSRKWRPTTLRTSLFDSDFKMQFLKHNMHRGMFYLTGNGASQKKGWNNASVQCKVKQARKPESNELQTGQANKSTFSQSIWVMVMNRGRNWRWKFFVQIFLKWHDLHNFDSSIYYQIFFNILVKKVKKVQKTFNFALYL